MNIKTLSAFLIYLAVAIWVPAAHGQSDPITVDVELSRSKVYIGDTLTYQVQVRGSDNPPTPTLDFPPSIRAEYRGRSSQSFTSIRMVQGQKRTVTDRLFSYQYRLTAIDTGELTIPSPTVTIDGQQYAGDSISFESLFPTRSTADEMTMDIGRVELYLNDTVEVQCVWWIGDDISDFSLESSMIPESFEMRGLSLQAGNAQRIGFSINGQKIVGVVVDENHNGQDMKKLIFRFTITPTETGAYELGPIRSVFTRLTGTGRNYRAYVEADPLVIFVKEVPTEGQPDGYTDAIGSFELKANASNTHVNVGDPIGLTLRISGKEPMVGIENAPSLSNDSAFTEYFKVSSEGWREVLPIQPGVRVFETTIRALNEHTQEIPSIELHSFDPILGSYKTYRSPPIAIDVQPVQELTLSDAIVTGGNYSSQPTQDVERIELTHAMPGLWAHGSIDRLMTEPEFSFRETITTPAWIAAAAAGPSLFALSCVVFGVRRSTNPRAQLVRRAWKTSNKLDRNGHHARALRVYLGAVLDISTNAITAQDINGLPIDEQDAIAATAYLVEDENADYIGDSNTVNASQEHQTGLLKRIHLTLQHWEGATS